MNKEKSLLFLIIVMGISLVGVIIYMFLYTNINLSDDLVSELYSYIGNDQISNCNDPLFYESGIVNREESDSSALLCNAYLQLTNSLETVEIEENEEGSCSIDALLLVTDYNSDVCTATKFSLDTIKDVYFSIYGQTLTEYVSFELSNDKICEYNAEDGFYYCFNASDEMTVSLVSSITYRLLKSAVKVYDGTFVIRDYFININDSNCYHDLANLNKHYTCTNYIVDNPDVQIDSLFMRTYSGLYEHTFKSDDNGGYYWISSKKIS